MGSDWGAHYRLACRYFHSSFCRLRKGEHWTTSPGQHWWSCEAASELALACLPWIVLTLSSSFFLSKSFFCVFNHNISQCHNVLGLLVLNNTAWKHLFGPGDQQSHQDTSSENHKCFHAFFMSIDLSCAEIFHPVVQEDESDDHQEWLLWGPWMSAPNFTAIHRLVV